jgi:hypothetical protein
MFSRNGEGYTCAYAGDEWSSIVRVDPKATDTNYVFQEGDLVLVKSGTTSIAGTYLDNLVAKVVEWPSHIHKTTLHDMVAIVAVIDDGRMHHGPLYVGSKNLTLLPETIEDTQGSSPLLGTWTRNGDGTYSVTHYGTAKRVWTSCAGQNNRSYTDVAAGLDFFGDVV